MTVFIGTGELQTPQHFPSWEKQGNAVDFTDNGIQPDAAVRHLREVTDYIEWIDENSNMEPMSTEELDRLAARIRRCGIKVTGESEAQHIAPAKRAAKRS